MSNWMNEAGEPYMTAAQLRFEAELDEQSAYERQYDDYYNDDYDEACYGDRDDCPMGGCDECDDVLPEDEDEGWPMEDQWLDGSYEE